MHQNTVLFIIEIIIILSVICYQIFHSIKTYKKILILQDIFQYPIKVKNGYIERDKLSNNENPIEDIVFIEDGDDNTPVDLFANQNIVRVSITKTSTENDIIARISKNINIYLLNNYGAPVSFSIIKDIIDREVDLMDEEISQAIPTPLYLGLAATMVGIIFGLLAMPELKGADFSVGIDNLIAGVRLAMTASLMGLVCTTILSSFLYRDAKKKIQRGQNDQFSYLQAKLLPELIKAEDTGISGLRASFDRFSINQVDYLKHMIKTSDKLEENFNQHLEIIEKLKELDVKKVSIINLDLLRKLEKNMGAFNEFSNYLALMEQISNNLKEFASRTTNIDSVVNNIDESLQGSNRLTQFLTSHFEKIENAGGASLKAVDIADTHFREAIEKLKEGIDNRISKLNETADIHETDLKEIYRTIFEDLSRITSEHIKQFQEAYSNAVPQFNQLDHLEVLPGFKEQVGDNTSKLRDESNTNTFKLIDSINKLNSSLNGLKDKVNNEAILKKLGAIEKKLKKGNAGKSNPTQHSSLAPPGKSGFLRKVIKNTVRLVRRNKR